MVEHRYVNLAPDLRIHQKKAQKMDHSIAIYSTFRIGIVYFECYLVNPHVQTAQNMYGKGG